tara:strand:- start:1027 stop:1266 length:240 start_codon:yes stop_codon:yes gene_type:complete
MAGGKKEMTYFTVMILSYTLSGEPIQSKILFPSAKACGDALTTYYEPIRAFDKDSSAHCIKTKMLSMTLRPKARPDKWN